MPAGPLKRKLSAILATDAVSYSRKMSENEEGTMRVLSAHRAVIDGIIEFHDGRIANTAGDSVLAEFASPVEAVRCAVEIQDALRTRNDSLPLEQRLEFRVGVNFGDVMVKGSDLLGDGVNIAARLESIAEPGGICISSSIHDMIRGKLDLGFVDIGEQSLKNIEHPIRVYRVDRDGMAPAGPNDASKTRRRRVPVMAGVLVTLVLLLAAAWFLDLLPQMPWEAERQRQVAAETERRAKIEADLVRAQADAAAAQRKAEA
jgi:class 3 adenylate cyclase